MISILDRYKGVLLGAAVGDALGQPVEGILTEEETKTAEAKYGSGPWSDIIRSFQEKIKTEYGGSVKEMLQNPFGYWQAGEYTDDTTQTLLLVDSFIDSGRYLSDDFLRRLLIWFDHGNAKGIGGEMKKSLLKIEQGIPWRDLACHNWNKNFGMNGSLMRTSPVGLLFRGNVEEIDRISEEISSITHPEKTARIACQIASQLVGQLVNGVSKNEALSFIKERYREVYGEMIRSSITTKYSVGAFESLSTALIAFENANSFEEAVINAVNQGGDTDTYGSITGTFAGANWGIGQIPERWSKEIKPLNSNQIVEKSKRLYSLNQILVRG